VTQLLLHHLHRRDVGRRHQVLLLDLLEEDGKVLDQLLLLAALPEELGHVGSQLADDKGVDLGHPGALDEVVEFAQGSVLR